MTTRRKAKPKDSRRNSLQVTLTDDEKVMIDKAAESSALPTAAFIRSKAIEAAKLVLGLNL